MTEPVFACVIPGRSLTTAFKALDAKKMILEVPSPGSISEFSLSYLKPTLPAGTSIGVYYSGPPFSDWQYMGMLSVEHPSFIFRAPWAGLLPPTVTTLQLGVALEPTISLLNLEQANEQKQHYQAIDSTKGIAQDLMLYMTSYAQSTGKFSNMGDVLVIPSNCVDKWFEKFQQKHKNQPFFWLKQKQNTL